MSERNDAVDGEDDLVAALNAELDKSNDIPPLDEVESEDESVDEEPSERLRDEKGRFAKADEQESEKPEGEESPQGAVGEEPKPTEEVSPQSAPDGEAKAYRPPAGWSPASKVDFDALPAHIKADIAKREAEVDAGFQMYAGLREWVETAKQAGTSLPNVLRDYQSIENELNRDFIRGVEYICQRYRVDPQALSTALTARYGATQAQDDGQNQTTRFDPDAVARMAEERARAAARQEFEERQMIAEVEAFKADPANRFFENVKEQMAALLNSKQAEKLTDAYQQACWLNPEVRAILLKEEAAKASQSQSAAEKAKAAAQARDASKSITGAPAHGAKPAKAPDKTLEQELLDAWNEREGSV